MTVYIIHSKQMWESCEYSTLDRTLAKLKEIMEHLDDVGEEYVISIDRLNVDFNPSFDEDTQRMIE